MSVASLEKFNKQFENQPPRTVSRLLELEKAGEFSFYLPVSDKLDTATLVDKIEACLPEITEIVRAPYIILKSEYKQVRAELAGNLSPQAIQMTVRDPKLWKKKNGKLRPEFVYARTNEDEYNTYENRVVKSLIDKVVRFLNLPMEYAKDGIKNLYEAYFQSAVLNKLDLMKLMDQDLYKGSDRHAYADYKKLFYLRAKFAQLKSSAFYKIMAQYPPFTGGLEVTNLFSHNRNYNACFRLWRFLDEFNAGLSVLSPAEQESAYCAFVSLAMISLYVRLGFTITGDALIAGAAENFSLKNFTLENLLFKVILSASGKKIAVTVQCRKVKLQQTTDIYLHTDIAEPIGSEGQFVVSLYKTDYSDRTACVVPGNKNSLKDLESIVRCTVLTFEVEEDIYNKLCLICGSPMLDDKGYFYRCEDCGAAYSFLDARTVWINRFNVLGEKKDG